VVNWILVSLTSTISHVTHPTLTRSLKGAFSIALPRPLSYVLPFCVVLAIFYQ